MEQPSLWGEERGCDQREGMCPPIKRQTGQHVLLAFRATCLLLGGEQGPRSHAFLAHTLAHS